MNTLTAADPETSILERRRIEVLFVQELLVHLEAEIGRDRALAIVRATTSAMARRHGETLARGCGSDAPGLEAFARQLPLWERDGALEVRYLERGERRLAFDVTRCRYAEMYRDLGASDLGAAMSCHRDGELCRGFDRRVRFERTQTIMQGASHCDFRYTLDEDGAAP